MFAFCFHPWNENRGSTRRAVIKVGVAVSILLAGLMAIGHAFSTDNSAPPRSVSGEPALPADLPEPTTPELIDAITREFSVHVESPPPLPTDAISREFTVHTSAVGPVAVTDAVSRELSAFTVIPIGLGVPYEGTLPVASYLYFRLETPPDLTVRVTLDHGSETAWTEVYAHFGSVPPGTDWQHAAAEAGEPDQIVVIASTMQGMYFIQARSTNDTNATAATSFTILAESVPFDLRFAAPDVMGAGVATLEIHGARFTSETTFQLRNPDTDEVFPATSVEFIDAATVLATFDMTAAELRPYDILADDPGFPTATLSQGVEVVPASDMHFIEASVDFPSRIRGGRPTNGTVYIANTGNMDIPVVTYGVLVDNDDRLDLSVPEVYHASADPTSDGTRKGISLISTVLRLGETRAVSFTVRATTQFPGHGRFTLGFHATAYSFAGFRDGPLYQVSEATRLAVLSAEGIPDEVRLFAQDEAYWWQVMRDYYDEHGLTGDGAARSAENVVVSGGPIDIGIKTVLCGFLGVAATPFVTPYGGVVIATTCEVITVVDPDDVVEEIVHVLQTGDPNEKVGPSGFSQGQFVQDSNALLYRVCFENLATASAPAAEVRVTDVLDPSVNVSTFRLRRIHFGETTIEVPEGRSSYETTLDLLAEHGVLVNVQAAVDAINRTASWSLRALDPDTMQVPADPLLGFLPPNDETGRGEGYVEFTIKPNANTPTGTVITNKASIVFDYNDPIETNEVSNTIDSGAPTSSVTALPTESLTPFVVRWEGQDDTGGSGVGNYAVSVKTDNGAFVPWQSSAGTWGYFAGEVGKTYAFYTVATDNVGNVETTPSQPDSTTKVTGRWVDCLAGPGTPHPADPLACVSADLDGDGDVDLEDVAALQLGSVAAPPPPP